MTDERFRDVYDDVVRRFWADPSTPLSIVEFIGIVERNDLAYPHLQGKRTEDYLARRSDAEVAAMSTGERRRALNLGEVTLNQVRRAEGAEPR